MPPKPKFSREEIITAAYNLVRKKGSDAVTAREVGKQLGVSSSPIFTMFRDMEELRVGVTARAKATFDKYINEAEGYTPAFKKRGMQWVKFAQEEPMLFRLLFMCDNGSDTDFDSVLNNIPFGNESDIEIITHDYHATPEQAQELFRQMWIYTYGLCSLCAAKVCRFTDEEISLQLSEIFFGMVSVLKNGDKAMLAQMPTANGTPKGEWPDLSK